jgi:hypothetical protein
VPAKCIGAIPLDKTTRRGIILGCVAGAHGTGGPANGNDQVETEISLTQPTGIRAEP